MTKPIVTDVRNFHMACGWPNSRLCDSKNSADDSACIPSGNKELWWFVVRGERIVTEKFLKYLSENKVC